MARIDWTKAAREKEASEAYEKLKKHIASKDSKGVLNKHFAAYDHLYMMESKIEEQERQLAEYKAFFNTLGALLPRQFSTLDIIG